MIFSNQHITRPTVRFRKWTNTPYAVFNSLKKEIHIGFVSMIIRDINTLKSMTLRPFFKAAEEGDEEESHEKSSIFHDGVQGNLLSDELTFQTVAGTFVEDLSNSNSISFYLLKALLGPFFIGGDLDNHLLMKYRKVNCYEKMGIFSSVFAQRAFVVWAG